MTNSATGTATEPTSRSRSGPTAVPPILNRTT